MPDEKPPPKPKNVTKVLIPIPEKMEKTGLRLKLTFTERKGPVRLIELAAYCT